MSGCSFKDLVLSSWLLRCLIASAVGLAGVLAVTGCSESGDKQQVTPAAPIPNVVFVYPYDGQKEVSSGTAISVAFSEAMDLASVKQGFKLVNSDLQQPVAGDIVVDPSHAHKFLFVPEVELFKNTHYQVKLTNIVAAREVDDQAAASDRAIQNSTSSSKPINQNSLDKSLSFTTQAEPQDHFVVETHNFAASTPFMQPFMQYSSLKLDFSQPLDSSSIVLGQTLTLINLDSGELIDCEIYIQQHKITIDPKVDLTANKRYELRLTNNIKSSSGESLTPFETILVPKSPGPYSTMALTLTASANTSSDTSTGTSDRTPSTALMNHTTMTSASKLFMQRENAITESSPLTAGQTQLILTGTVNAELAYAPDFPEVTPFAIRRGQTLYVKNTPLLLNGSIPLAMGSGNITASVLSDATGYLTRNKFSDDRYANNNVHLQVDTVLTSDNPKVNAIINQQVLHVDMMGLMNVEDGIKKLDIMGTAQLFLYEDMPITVMVVIHAEDDDSPQELRPRKPLFEGQGFEGQEPANFDVTIVTPGPDASNADPASHIVLRFNEAFLKQGLEQDPTSNHLKDRLKLQAIDASGNPAHDIDFTVSVVANTLKIIPLQPLDYNQQYLVSLAADLAGNERNTLAENKQFQFKTFAYEATKPQAMLVLGINPGYPCVLTEIDYFNKSAGRCAGGKESDDIFPFFSLPANYPIDVFFSQPVASRSITLGHECDEGSVRIERIDDEGRCLETVAGELKIFNKHLVFKPTKPWQTDQAYQITLMSSDADTVCDADEICGANNFPLNTDPMRYQLPFPVPFQSKSPSKVSAPANPEIPIDVGGAPLKIPFVGTASKNTFMLGMPLTPVADNNGNGEKDASEFFQETNSMLITVPSTKPPVSAIRVGCADSKKCSAAQQSVNFNSALMVLINDYNPADSSIAMDLVPQILYGTSLDMTVELLGGLGKIKVSTGPLLFRVRMIDGKPIKGRIFPPEPDAKGEPQAPQVELNIELYVDAPYVNVFNGLIGTNLKSAPLSFIARGPLIVGDDGRIDMTFSNLDDISLDFGVHILDEDLFERLKSKEIKNNPLLRGIVTLMHELEVNVATLVIPENTLHARVSNAISQSYLVQ